MKGKKEKEIKKEGRKERKKERKREEGRNKRKRPHSVLINNTLSLL
jgi:hypothetical protein